MNKCGWEIFQWTEIVPEQNVWRKDVADYATGILNVFNGEEGKTSVMSYILPIENN